MMATVKVDREWEAAKKHLLEDGIGLLEVRKGKTFTSTEELESWFEPNDKETLKVKVREVILELEEYINNEEKVKSMEGEALLWLTNGGYKEVLKRYTSDEIIWMDNFITFWEEGLIYLEELEPNKPENSYYKPNLLFWAVYITVRGDYVVTFPKYQGIYTYIFRRLGPRLDKMRDMGFNVDPLDDLALGYLETKLKDLDYEGRKRVESLGETRRSAAKDLGRRPLPEWLQVASRLHKEGLSKEEIYKILTQKTTVSNRPPMFIS